MRSLVCSLLIAIFSLAISAPAGLLFDYSKLALKDLDQMNKLVKAKVRESKKSGGNKVVPLKEALQAVYCRPNEDFMIEKLVPSLRTELEEQDAWEPTIESLVKEAIGALNNSKAFKPVVLATYSIFLDNILSEMKPKAGSGFENKIVTKIKDAKIKISKEINDERALRMLKKASSPSETAEKILEEIAAAQKAAEKEADKKK